MGSLQSLYLIVYLLNGGTLFFLFFQGCASLLNVYVQKFNCFFFRVNSADKKYFKVNM